MNALLARHIRLLGSQFLRMREHVPSTLQAYEVQVVLARQSHVGGGRTPVYGKFPVLRNSTNKKQGS